MFQNILATWFTLDDWPQAGALDQLAAVFGLTRNVSESDASLLSRTFVAGGLPASGPLWG